MISSAVAGCSGEIIKACQLSAKRDEIAVKENELLANL